METRTINVYSFRELSAEAKAKAKADHAANFGYAWEREAWASMEAMAAHFGAEIDDYAFDYFGGPLERLSFHFHEQQEDGGYDMKPAEIARRLKKLGRYNRRTGKGLGECVLTGYCMDEDAIDGFRLAWRAGERNLGRLLRAAFRSWLNAAQAECAHEYSDEGFGETAEANDWKFYEDGRFYK